MLDNRRWYDSGEQVGVEELLWKRGTEPEYGR